MDQKNMDFLTRLEKLQFSLSNSNNTNPSSQADAIRNIYLHLSEGRERNNSGHLAYIGEANQNKEMYANVVDNMDESGLNNFAAGALSLCHYHKNDSSKWQTSLTGDSIVNLSCFQDKNKEMKSNLMDYSNLTMPIKTKRLNDYSSGISNPSSSSSRLLSNNTLPKLQNPDPCPSVPPPTGHFISGNSRAPQNPSYSSRFKEDNFAWKRQPESTHSDSFRKYPTSRHSSTDGIYKSYKSDNKESINISTSKAGGPYANFGQKPKKGQDKWNYAKETARSEDEGDESIRQTPFRTAREQFIINQQKKHGSGNDRHQVTGSNYGSVKKSLGTRRGLANKFVPPVLGQDSDEGDDHVTRSSNSRNPKSSNIEVEEPVDERLKGIDSKMIELIRNDIMDQGSPITWTDIAGLDFAKKTIQEIVVWPMLRPDIFTGLRGPPKGLLLFGPPGTGKTLIGKCIASQSKSTFFCISASSLTSKWVGEGEKMVRALFAVARCSQPAVVFIDEVDSLLSQRSDSEHESSRRIKTEFLVQLDGASTASDERLLVIGATNRPQEIDEAARRRFVKRLLIPLPEKVARRQIIINLVSQQRCDLSDSDLDYICSKTDGYSGADMSNLCREAALGPIRSIPLDQMETITSDQVRPMILEDFEQALFQVRASVSSKDLELYVDWNKTYGSFGH